MNTALLSSAAYGLLGALILTGCGNRDEASATTGAAIGGIIGERRDALTGDPIGTEPDYLVGVLADNRRQYADGAYHTAYPRSRYPLASTTDRRGIVRSPYPPNNLVDVRNIPPGERVVDPSVNRIFTRP